MIDDAELIAQLEIEEALALDAQVGELAKQRALALDRYKGAPLGNEIEGRSQVVDKSIADTVEWIMPSLIRIYLGGDDIGEFEAISAQDEPAAKVETEVCNWYLTAKNDYFSHISAALRDALLLKNGYIVGFWNKRYDTMTETYIGLADEEVAMIQGDPEVEIVEHTEYADPNAPQMPPDMGSMMEQTMPPQQMLHDIKVERKTCEEYAAIESVPPDEILVSRRHRWTSLMDADFVEWKRHVSIGQLRSEGFNIPDDVPKWDGDEVSIEWTERQRFLVEQDDQDESVDITRRIVTFRDAYYRTDLRGTGKPQLWRIARIGRTMILKEEANIVPFAAFSPILYPHSHVGTSIYDLIDDIGVIKTVVLRQYIDGLFLQTSGQRAYDQNKVNLDDALISRPGNVIRVDGDPSTAIFPLQTADLGQSALNGLEYLSTVNEQRTGVTRYSAGLDANTLNKTATGIQQIQSAANQRIELIARTLAGGFRDLFLIVHELALQHSTKPLQLKLNGKWVPVNPREWKRRTDFQINVGLGTGTPEQQVQKLMMMGQPMQMALQMGLAGPQEVYEYIAELWKAQGYRLSDRFLHEPPRDPQTGQPVQPPQQPPPEVQAAQIKAQADQQMAQVKMQSDNQIAQAKAAADSQVQQARMQADMAIQQHKVQSDAQLEIVKTKMQLELDAMRHSLEQQTQIEIAKIKAAAQVQAADITATKMQANSLYPQEMAQ